ncbi:MAG: hypothetical protein L0Z50_28625 [Verrucomicrobiales bacterium]|nr:hypothetical protein [Verrucomicrobiales bacterium]
MATPLLRSQGREPLKSAFRFIDVSNAEQEGAEAVLAGSEIGEIRCGFTEDFQRVVESSEFLSRHTHIHSGERLCRVQAGRVLKGGARLQP